MDDPASLFLLFAAETASVETPTLLSTILNFLLVLFLVLGNGFFVASEFALVAVRKSRIEALVAEGSKAAERLLGFLNNLNAYISATQLGITLSSLGLGYVGEPAIVSVIEPILIEYCRIGKLAISCLADFGARRCFCDRFFIYYISAHRFRRTRAENRRARIIGKSFADDRSAAANFLQNFLLSDSSARLGGNKNR